VELTDLHSSPNIIRVIKSNMMGGACSAYGGEQRRIQSFGGETCGRYMVDNIKMDIQEVGRERINWNNLAQDRDRRQALVNAVRNLQVP